MTIHSYRTDYLRVEKPAFGTGKAVLYCDPLTSLVAYPSFEQYLIAMLPVLVAQKMHMAIGDVDGLREYVSERKTAGPASFGHLAGNACMQTIGVLTRDWAQEQLMGDFHVCGTFGGDEVIIAANGLSHDAFTERVHSLCRNLKASSPRPCSFALATLEPCEISEEQARDAYRAFVSFIDAKLFSLKEDAQLEGRHLEGVVADLGTVSLRRGDAEGGFGYLTLMRAAEGRALPPAVEHVQAPSARCSVP